MNRQNTTDFAVSTQLAALAHGRYEVGISLPAQPDHKDERKREERLMIRRWTAAEIEKSLGFLKAQNMRGSHVYVRPEGEHAYSFVDDLTAARVAEMKQAGFPPALVVESSPNNFQAWVAHGQTLDAATSTRVAKELAAQFGGDPSSADWRHFGRLAGFTNRKEKHQREDGRFPFVRIIEAEGRIAPGSQQLIEKVRADMDAERANELARRAAYTPSAPADPAARKSIDDFRNSTTYGGDHHRADLAYATYALSRGVDPRDIEAAIRTRDLAHKGSSKRQADYIERTLDKARDAQSPQRHMGRQGPDR